MTWLIEAFLADLHEEFTLYFKTPEELKKIMSSFKYKNFTTLMNWKKVYETKSGSCHDQVMFELYMLRKMGLNVNARFLIEYKKKSNVGGRTHSYVYYKYHGNYYWFENAWKSQEGIHGPYNSRKDIEKEITEKMLKESKYDFVEFAPFRGKEGMTLQELVDACMD